MCRVFLPRQRIFGVLKVFSHLQTNMFLPTTAYIWRIKSAFTFANKHVFAHEKQKQKWFAGEK